jgi:hypothetical protein
MLWIFFWWLPQSFGFPVEYPQGQSRVLCLLMVLQRSVRFRGVIKPMPVFARATQAGQFEQE